MIKRMPSRIGKKTFYFALLCILLFGQMWTPTTYSPERFTDNDTTDGDHKKGNLLDRTTPSPLAQNYVRNQTGSKQNVNVTIHQAYEDNSINPYTETSNTFSVPAPNATDYNISNSNIKINNINVNNYTYPTYNGIHVTAQDLEYEKYYATSLELNSSCYITNASFFLRKYSSGEGYGDDGPVDVYLMNSSWSISDTENYPDKTEPIHLGTISITSISPTWYYIDFSDTYMDISKTDNNTYYIALKYNGTFISTYLGQWYYNFDSSGYGYSKSYKQQGTIWIDSGIDFFSTAGLSLHKTQITPEEINLKINDLHVKNNSLSPSHNSGYWDYTGFGSNGAENINFEFSADWYDYSFEVNHTLFNYTKNYQINTEYSVESGDLVFWNATQEIQAFDYRLNNNTVNFTIPNHWINRKLNQDLNTPSFSTWNNVTTDILQVFDGGAQDGNWTLLAQSTNYLSQLKAGVDNSERSLVYADETVVFNVSSSPPISGDVNVSVYHPDDTLSFSNISTVADATEIDWWPWIVKENITEYGEYRVQATWENLTDLAIQETNLIIAGPTNYTVLTTEGDQYLDSDPAFNISFYYADTAQHTNISGATVEYKNSTDIPWKSDSTQANPDNTYNVTIYPANYAVGSHTINININSSYYLNQSFDFSFSIVEDTYVQKLYGESNIEVIRGHNATFYFNYLQVEGDTAIEDATITKLSGEGTSFEQYISNGKYSIEINTSTIDVGNNYTLEYRVSKLNFESIDFQFDINITQAQTEIILVSQNDTIKRNSLENITVFMKVNDTDNEQLISGIPNTALTVYNITEGQTIWDTPETQDWWLWEVGNGEYGVNISLGGPNMDDRINKGTYSVLLNISHIPNYNWSTYSLSFYVEGNATDILIEEVNDAEGGAQTGNNIWTGDRYELYQTPGPSDDIIGVKFDFVDLDDENERLIDPNAITLWALLDNTQEIQVENFDYSATGLYLYARLRLPADLPSATYNISLEASLFNYENGSTSFNLTILNITTELIPPAISQPSHIEDPSVLYISGTNTYYAYSKYDLQVRIKYNDTLNNLFIDDSTNTLAYGRLTLDGNDYYPYDSYDDFTDEFVWDLGTELIEVGSYVVNINIGKHDYNNATYSFNLEVIVLPTSLTNFDITQPQLNTSTLAGGTPYAGYLAYNLVVNASYYDDNNTEFIDETNIYAQLEYNNKNYSIAEYGYYLNNRFGWLIPVNDLKAGIQDFTIYFGKEDYANASFSFQVDFDPVATDITLNSILQPDHTLFQLPEINPDNYSAFRLYTVMIDMHFENKINSSTLIDGATTDLIFKEQSYPLVFEGNGLYRWNLTSDLFTLGTYEIEIQMNLTGYVNQTYWFNITLNDLPTRAAEYFEITQPDHNSTGLPTPGGVYLAYKPFGVVINATYEDLNNTVNITDAEIAYLQYQNFNYSANSFNGTHYGWIIPIVNLTADLTPRDVVIYFQKQYFQNQTYTFQVQVDYLPTTRNLVSITQPNHSGYGTDELVWNGTSYLAYRAYNLAIDSNFLDPTNGTVIADATVTLRLDEQDYPSNPLANGLYSWNLVNTELGLGSFLIELSFNQTYHYNQTLSFYITFQDLNTSIAENFSITQPIHNGSQLWQDGEVYIAYKPFGVWINVSYIDLNNSDTSIADATVINLNYNGQDYSGLYYASSELYGWEIPLEDLVANDTPLTVTLTLERQYYINRTFTLDLETRILPTEFKLPYLRQPVFSSANLTYNESESWYEAYWFYDVVVNMTFTDPINSSSDILLADTTLSIDGVEIPTGGDFTDGYYNWILDNLDFELGPNVIRIDVNKTYYQNHTYYLTINHKQLPTETLLDTVEDIYQPDFNGPAEKFSGDYWFIVYDPFNVYVNISYRNTAYTGPGDSAEEYIGQAFNKLSLNGTLNYTATYDPSAQVYSFNISKDDLEVANYTVIIYFGKQFYQNQTFSLIQLNVQTLTTLAEFNDDIFHPNWIGHENDPLPYENSYYQAYVLYNISIEIRFVDLVGDDGLEADTAILDYEGQIFYGTYLGFNGNYEFLIPAENLTVGETTVEITFTKATFDDATKLININITRITTDTIFTDDVRQPDINPDPIAPVGSTFSVYVLYNVSIRAIFRDTVNNNGITTPDTAILAVDGINVIGTHVANGEFVFEIPADNLSLGEWSIEIRFEKQFYDNATYNLQLNVIRFATSVNFNDILQTDHQAVTLAKPDEFQGYQAYLPFDLDISAYYYDEVILQNINSGTTAVLYLNAIERAVDTIEGNVFTWNLPQTLLSPGKHNITLRFSKPLYENATFSFNLTVNIVSTEIIFDQVIQPDQSNGNITYDNSTMSYEAYTEFPVMVNFSYRDSIIDTGIQSVGTATLDLNGSVFISNFDDNGVFGWLIPSANLTAGFYRIEINLQKFGYQNHTYNFNLTVYNEAILVIETVNLPTEIVQGQPVTLTFRLYYEQKGEIYPLAEKTVTLSVNISGIEAVTKQTNASGYVSFEITVPESDYRNIRFTLFYDGEAYGIAASEQGFATRLVPPSAGLPMWIIWAILALFGFIGAAVLVQRKIIEPRRMHYTDLVTSSATIFEDAINVQHIIIIYKSMGTAIFFKSFAEEELDPDLISGFLSAVQSFGKELKSQKSLNELSYGDKTLLFADGEFIRVTLVLGKPASPYLKHNLAEFVGKFESKYNKELKAWRGKIDQFQDAGDLVDDILRTSVILPHQLNENPKLRKNITRNLGKKLLDMIEELITEDRPFIFLAQLLEKALNETDKEPGEVILALDELLELKILEPIKIEDIGEVKELSSEELQALRDEVWELPEKSETEKEELLNQLRKLHASEREVILSSLKQSLTISTESSAEVIETQKFENAKQARKEINKIGKEAKKAFKDKDFDTAINKYEIAEVLAYQWNLDSLGKRCGNLTIQTTIDKYKHMLKTAKKQMAKHEKHYDYPKAKAQCEKALGAANALFKLGLMEYEENVKKLTGKLTEFKSELHEKPIVTGEYITKENLLKARKNFEKQWKKVRKSDDILEKNAITMKLLLIANQLFKFGQVNESSNIKEYHNRLEANKREIDKLTEQEQAELSQQITDLQAAKDEFIKMGNVLEKQESYLDAIVAYQNVMQIYEKIGDTDNAIALHGKMESLSRKIPDIFNQLKNLQEELSTTTQTDDQELIRSRIKALKKTLYLVEK